MVYIDKWGTLYRGKYRYHLTADTKEELHRLAAKAEVKRCWYHNSNSGTPHYDVTWMQRVVLLALGAVPGIMTSRGPRLQPRSDEELQIVANDTAPMPQTQEADYDDCIDFELLRIQFKADSRIRKEAL